MKIKVVAGVFTHCRIETIKELFKEAKKISSGGLGYCIIKYARGIDPKIQRDLQLEIYSRELQRRYLTADLADLFGYSKRDINNILRVRKRLSSDLLKQQYAKSRDIGLLIEIISRGIERPIEYVDTKWEEILNAK